MTLYKDVYNTLKEEIETGVLGKGTRLVSDDELALRFDVSKITISKAMRLLKDDGFITRRPKKGSYVRSHEAIPVSPKLTVNPIHTLGIVLPSFNDLFGADFLKYFLLLTNQQYNVVIKLSNSDYALEEEMIRKLIDEGAEAVVLLPTSSTIVSPLILDLITRNFPIIILDRTLSDLPICSILSDNEQAAHDLTKLLIDNGHRSIGMLSHASKVSSVSDRIRGFQDAHMEQFIPMSKNQILEFDAFNLGDQKLTRQVTDRIKQYLTNNSNLTAVFCEEYALVYPLIIALSELGKSIPEDLSIVCVDHPPIVNSQTDRIITHIKQDETLLAKKLLDLIAYKTKFPKKFRKEMIPGKLVAGNTIKQLV